jgi:peptidoglycan/xylan/chitin deacetylase (PgdA/CDA1 family)
VSGVPILMYHALTPARTEGFARWTLSAYHLEQHLAYLASRDYRTVTIAELTALGIGEDGDDRQGGCRLIALTFDDAYADFHDVALPLLARYRMTATLFVPTGYVGGRSGWMCDEGEGDRRILSWTALAEVASAGIEIGAHSHSHPAMDRLHPRHIPGQARLPKAELEHRLGRPVRSFAYPYGRYDRRVRDAVEQAGYRAACTMNSWAATPRSHRFELPRTAVFRDTDVTRLADRLAASRDAPRRAVLRIKRRLAGS